MLIDTSVIIETFRSPSNSARFKKITKEIGDEEIYVSMIQLAEVADWATRNQVHADSRIAVIKQTANIAPLDEQICLDASKIKYQRRKSGYTDFGLLDAIILATARSIGQRVLTFDKDFTGESDCVLLT